MKHSSQSTPWERLYDALLELVECKDLKESFNMRAFRVNLTDAQQAEERAKYERRKPLAWDNARKVLVECAPSESAVSAGVPITEEFAEFIGRLSDLAHTSSFWEEKPYSNRLYYGIGGGDYIARDILQAFLHALKKPQSATAPIGDEINSYWAFVYSDGSIWTDDIFDTPKQAERFAASDEGRPYTEGATLRRVVIRPADRTAMADHLPSGDLE